MMVDLPDPVAPTMAKLSPAFIEKLTSSKTWSFLL